MRENSLVKNSIYYILYRTINIIYPLITATYVSRVLEPDGVGEVSLAQTVVIFLVACALLGIPNYGVREISKVNDRDELSVLFSELLIINAISTAIVATLYYGIIYAVELNVNRALYYIEGIILLLNVANVDWFYQGIENFKYITRRSCVVKILSVFAIFLFVNSKEDICVYAFIFAMAYAGNYLLNIINLRKYVRFTIKNIHPRRHVNKVLVLAVTYISNEIYVTMDSVMLGVLSTNSEVGYYSNSMKVIRILVNVVTAAGVALLPRLSLLRKEGDEKRLDSIINQAAQLLLLITIPSMLGMAFIADDLVIVLFGSKFDPAAPIISVLSALIVLRGFSNLFLQVLISFGRDANTSIIYFSAMLGNMAMNYFLIQWNGGVGAALASIISEAYIMCSLYIIFKRYSMIRMKAGHIGSVLLSSFLMCMTVCIIYWIIDLIYIRLILSVVAGAFVYFLSGYVTKNESIRWMIEAIRRRKHATQG